MSFWNWLGLNFSRIVKILGQSSVIYSEKSHTLNSGNYLNFVLDCGSSDVTCAAGNVPQYSFMLSSFLKPFGICKFGLPEILFSLG